MANVAVDAGVSGNGITRREFLYYIWGASIALLTVEAAGLMVWFLIPKFREGEFGGPFPVTLDQVPEPNSDPRNFPDGRFWLVNLDTTQPNQLMYKVSGDPEQIVGIAAIYKVCTHLGCIFSWTDSNNRFECPCHGSKYRLDGRRIEDPAPRNLDRFKLYAMAEDKTTVLAESADVGEVDSNPYAAVVLPPGTASIIVDTGDRKQGNAQALLSNFADQIP
ncbi:MAG: ubiquinol-cytochrome c reductase iron-sulfur subunit [Chloroflexota bacterium]|jgi:cytochrome b6-f complex iron-sulfur subunit